MATFWENTDLFENGNVQNIVDFVKEIHFYAEY